MQRDGNHGYEWMELLDDSIMEAGNAIQMTAASSLSWTISPLLSAPAPGLESQPTGTLWCL